MKEIQKVVPKLSREQESAAGGGGGGGDGVQKHKVTPGIPGWLNNFIYSGIKSCVQNVSQLCQASTVSKSVSLAAIY